MKRMQTILAGTAGALTLVVVTAVVAAPNGPLAGMGHGVAMGPAMMGGMGMMHGGGAAMLSAERLSELKTRLSITPQQEAAWQAFATKATEQAALMQASHDQHHGGAETNGAAPDAMARHIGLMTQHLAGMEAVNATLKDLYAVLTPEQRSLADASIGRMGPRGHGRGMHG